MGYSPRGHTELDTTEQLSMRFSRQEYWSGVPLPSPNMLSRLVITFLPRSKHLYIYRNAVGF